MPVPRTAVIALWTALAGPLFAQLPYTFAESRFRVRRLEPGVTPPKLIRKVEPEYTWDARTAAVQGLVTFHAVVSECGKLTGIRPVSTLGFGLDERAGEALGLWDFAPGKKAGAAVKVPVTIEIEFRHLEAYYSPRSERRRTDFNVAMKYLSGDDEQLAADAIETIRKLARKKYPPAMGVLGIMMRNGDRVPCDPDQAAALIQGAAAGHYPPAMYRLGMMYLEGENVQADRERGLALLLNASVFGSAAAQYYLGTHYETGKGLPKDADRAARYLRLCADSGIPLCQFRLGKLLRSRNPVQALAWLQLAAEQGLADAKQPADEETARLAEGDRASVVRLKACLRHRP